MRLAVYFLLSSCKCLPCYVLQSYIAIVTTIVSTIWAPATPLGTTWQAVHAISSCKGDILSSCGFPTLPCIASCMHVLNLKHNSAQACQIS